MVTYPGGMATDVLPGQGVPGGDASWDDSDLPEEAPDVTVSELHEEVLDRLLAALRIAFAGTALVLSDIFVRSPLGGSGKIRQAAPDILVIPGGEKGRRRVYRIPPDPVPELTIEILSYANYQTKGRALLEAKRKMFGELGVATHIEVDPDHGFVTIWENHSGELRPRGGPDVRYEGDALGGVRFAFDERGDLHIWLPSGREYLAPEEEAATIDRQAGEIERLTEALRRRGVDPAGS